MYHSDHQAKHHAKMHESHPLHTSRLQSHIQEHDYDETGLCKEIINKSMHVDGKGFNHAYGSSHAAEFDEQMEADVRYLEVKPGKKLANR